MVSIHIIVIIGLIAAVPYAIRKYQRREETGRWLVVVLSLNFLALVGFGTSLYDDVNTATTRSKE